MTNKTQTSRQWILDAVELIANLIAMSSHAQELINIYTIDFNGASESEQDDIISKINEQKIFLSEANRIRRNYMSALEKEFGAEKQLWCEFKHAVGTYGFACEVYAANPSNPVLEGGQQDCYELMNKVISAFLNLDELLPCGRCLADKLNSKWTLTDS